MRWHVEYDEEVELYYIFNEAGDPYIEHHDAEAFVEKADAQTLVDWLNSSSDLTYNEWLGIE